MPSAVRRVARPAQTRFTPRTESASIALAISSSASAGIAESTESATSAAPPLASRETCMPAMLTPASPRIRPTMPTMPGRSS